MADNGAGQPVAEMSIKVVIAQDGTQRVVVPAGMDVQLESPDTTNVFGTDERLVAPQLVALGHAEDTLLHRVGQPLPDGAIYMGFRVNMKGQMMHWARVPDDMVQDGQWAEGEDYAKTLTFGGYQDWSQPDIEASSIMKRDRDRIFSGTIQPNDIWTCYGKCLSNGNHAHTISFGSPKVEVFKDLTCISRRSAHIAICPVRSFQILHEGRGR